MNGEFGQDVAVSHDVAVRSGERWVVPGNRWDLLPTVAAPPPQVTAVVLHYQDPAGLALVLSALEQQTHPASRLQIVVADDGSDPLPEVPPHVTVVTQDDRGFRAAAARNLGAAAADGEMLCFLDGDTVPEPEYVAAACALPAVSDDVVVVGRRRHADLSGWSPTDLRRWFQGGAPPRELTEPTWLRDAYRDSHDLLDVDARSYRYVISAVLSCHRDLFAAVDGFDETMVGYGGEDWDFAHRAVNAGAVLAHRRDAVAWHDGPEWGERMAGTEQGRAQKQQEALELAHRIPDRVARGPGYHPSAPGLLAEVTGGEPAERVDAVRSLLSAHDDVLVVVDPSTAAACDHPQVTAEPVDRRILQRIPLFLEAEAPVGFDGLGAALTRMAQEKAGRLTTADGRVVVTAAGAAARSTRHGVELDRLFPVLTV